MLSVQPWLYCLLPGPLSGPPESAQGSASVSRNSYPLFCMPASLQRHVIFYNPPTPDTHTHLTFGNYGPPMRRCTVAQWVLRVLEAAAACQGFLKARVGLGGYQEGRAGSYHPSQGVTGPGPGPCLAPAPSCCQWTMLSYSWCESQCVL